MIRDPYAPAVQRGDYSRCESVADVEQVLGRLPPAPPPPFNEAMRIANHSARAVLERHPVLAGTAEMKNRQGEVLDALQALSTMGGGQ